MSISQKHFVELANDLAHANALIRNGDLPSARSVLNHLAFTIGATCSTFNHNFNWYKWNTAIFGDEPIYGEETEDVSGKSG